MIRTSTYATQKYALSDTYLLSPTTNIIKASSASGPPTTIISTTPPPNTDQSRTISLSGSPNIKFSFWFGQALGGHVIRIVGWNKTNDNKYIPNMLYRGTVDTLGTSTSTINGNSSMQPALTMTPSIVSGATFQPQIAVTSTISSTMNPIPYSYMPGSGTAPASLILNTFGFTHLNVEFARTTPDSSDLSYNAYVTEY